MRELIAHTKIDFMKYRWICISLSVVSIIGCVIYWAMSGDSKYGIDFRGGVEVVASFEKPVQVGEVRKLLDAAGITEATVQRFEGESNEFSIRSAQEKQGGESTGDRIKTALQAVKDNSATILKSDFVGPTIGEQIRRQALIAVAISLICILLYVSVRFEFSFALGGVVALLHDAVVTAGVVVLLGREFNSAVLAAVLTIIGYSINDTIVVFDRVRENLGRKLRREKKHQTTRNKDDWQALYELFNNSLNETLSRTIITAGETLFVTAMLWVFGGGELADLGFALTFGIMLGTYSSIYIASPIVLWYARPGSKKAA